MSEIETKNNCNRRIVVYVAGPYRAGTIWETRQNIRRAEEMAMAVWRAGFTALCPHLNTALFDGALPCHVWLHGGLELMKRCDAVLLVPGWEVSEGTQEEVRAAYEADIPVYTPEGPWRWAILHHYMEKEDAKKCGKCARHAG